MITNRKKYACNQCPKISKWFDKRIKGAPN